MTTATRQMSPSSVHQSPQPENGAALFAMMLRLRRFEEKAGMLFALGTLGAPCPLGIGQEAAMAVCAAHVPSSSVLLAMFRRPGLELALGVPPVDVFATLVPATGDRPGHEALVRVPGEAPLVKPVDEAAALATARIEPLVVLATAVEHLLPVLERRQERILPVLIVSADQKPAVWPLAPHVEVRDCDAADAKGLEAAFVAALSDPKAVDGRLALVLLTPPYIGHSRETGRRAPSRRDTRDPVALLRQSLIASRHLEEAAAAAIEATVRDEIAAAGRAVSLTCAP